jgi:hypothetical protein
MEEDIENIERVIDYIQLESPIIQGIGNAIYTDSLKRLIKQYKELENELNQLNTYILINGIDDRLKTATQIKIENYSEFLHQKRVERLEERIKELKDNSIPISVIQNKIDEYREKRNKLADGHFWDNERNINEDTSLFIAIETLKLLLEERNK